MFVLISHLTSYLLLGSPMRRVFGGIVKRDADRPSAVRCPLSAYCFFASRHKKPFAATTMMAMATTAGGGAPGVNTHATIPAHNGDILPVLQLAIPSITSYQPLSSIEQANAEGVRVSVTYGNDNNDTCSASLPDELFVKQVDASHYAHKKWADLRRTLIYARTEARFYAEIMPRLRQSGRLTTSHLAPECHLAECNLEGLIGEEETATDVNHIPTAGTVDNDSGSNAAPLALDQTVPIDLLKGKGGALVLTSLGSEKYFQKSPLSPNQAAKCLAAVAKLRAAAWENTELLQYTAERLSDKGGSYHLLIRNPKELENMVASWDHFRTSFYQFDPVLFEKESIVKLGQRIYDNAAFISQELSPNYNDDYATCVHGDYKAMNVFLPSDDSSSSDDAVMIDFASAGVGLGLSDVAMHITHALRPKDLKGGGEQALVDGYLEALDTERRHSLGKDVDDKFKPYPRDVAMRHYRLATVDYFRFILGRFWRSATPETFDKRKDSPNSTLVNRNVEAALAFVKRVDGYLAEFEAEIKD